MSNIKVTKEEFDFFIFDFIFYLFELVKLKIYDNLRNWAFLEFLKLAIFEIFQIGHFLNYLN